MLRSGLRHRNQIGASGRTRTDVCQFTKLMLLLLSHRGERNWSNESPSRNPISAPRLGGRDRYSKNLKNGALARTYT
jgi:hypothetical protein